MKPCLTSVCSHQNRPKTTVFAMGTLSPEQAPHRSEAMPEPYMPPLLWAKNTVFAMGTLKGEQALHL